MESYEVVQAQEKSMQYGRRGTFPRKLFEALESGKGIPYLTWTPNGKSIYIQTELYERKVMTVFPGLVAVNSYANIRRQLLWYSFTSHRSIDPEGIYSHPCFQRGRPDLLSGVKSRRASRKVSENGINIEDAQKNSLQKRKTKSYPPNVLPNMLFRNQMHPAIHHDNFHIHNHNVPAPGMTGSGFLHALQQEDSNFPHMEYIQTNIYGEPISPPRRMIRTVNAIVSDVATQTTEFVPCPCGHKCEYAPKPLEQIFYETDTGKNLTQPGVIQLDPVTMSMNQFSGGAVSMIPSNQYHDFRPITPDTNSNMSNVSMVSEAIHMDDPNGIYEIQEVEIIPNHANEASCSDNGLIYYPELQHPLCQPSCVRELQNQTCELGLHRLQNSEAVVLKDSEAIVIQQPDSVKPEKCQCTDSQTSNESAYIEV